MNKSFSKYISLLFVLFIPVFGYAQDLITSRAPNMSTEVSRQTVVSTALKSRCYLLSVAVDEFVEMAPLNSTANLGGVKFAAKNVLPLSYATFSDVYLHGRVNSNDVLAQLDRIEKIADSKSIVLVILASHGDVIDGNYYFITSDTQKNRVARSAVSGKELMDAFDRMAFKGAKVMVFIDTCHAAALFGGEEYNGRVCYFASSDTDEYAREIEKKSQFSIKLGQILSSNIPETKNNNYVMCSGIQAQLRAAVETVGKSYGQTFVCTSAVAEDFPVIRYREIKHSEFYLPSLIPWKVSDDNSALDWTMVALEGGSAISLLACGLVQEYYKKQIKINERNGFSTDVYKQRGRNCAVGCCISAGALLTSYVIRMAHVNKTYNIKYSGNNVASMNFSPLVTSDYAGMTLALKF